MTAPAAIPSVPVGGGFQTALAHASTENNSKTQSTSDAAKSTDREMADDSGGDEARTTAGGSNEQRSTLAEPDAGQAQRTTDAIETDASAVAGAASAGSDTGVTASTAGQPSSEALFRQVLVGSQAIGASPLSSSLRAVEESGTNAPIGSPSTKQDRSKAPTDLKKLASAVNVPVFADLGRLSVASLVSLQGPRHSQQGASSENSAKGVTPEDAAAGRGHSAAPIDGPGAGDKGSGPIAADATAIAPSTSQQPPAEPFDADLSLSEASGLPVSPALTSHVELGLAASNSTGASSAVTAAASSTMTDGVCNTKSAVAGSAGAALHAANNSQATQSPQADASKSGAEVVLPKATENGVAQATLQTLLTPSGSHESATAPRVTPGAPDAAHAGKAQDLRATTSQAPDEGTLTSGINSAKLIQTMGETEMHVGMHSAEFGDISIRTSISQQQMVTQISLDHNDLSQMISSHVSTVQAKLGEEYGLHSSIEINNQGAPLSGGQENSPQREQQSPGHSSGGMGARPAELSERVSSVVALPWAGSGHGLDITV